MIIIKNIIFDLGGVILEDKTNTFLKDLNIDKDIYDQLNIFFDNWQEMDLGNCTLEEKYSSCNYSSIINDKYKEYLIYYYKYRKINNELLNIIDKLKMNNYNVYILSDNNKEAFEYYMSNNLFNNIDGYVISYEYKTLKRDGKLFDILLNKYNLKGNECYFIDDSLININEAKKHGINCYLYNNNDDLYKNMISNGINIKED